jgi:hypothetical protein
LTDEKELCEDIEEMESDDGALEGMALGLWFGEVKRVEKEKSDSEFSLIPMGEKLAPKEMFIRNEGLAECYMSGFRYGSREVMVDLIWPHWWTDTGASRLDFGFLTGNFN